LVEAELRSDQGRFARPASRYGPGLEKAIGTFMGLEEGFQPAAQRLVLCASQVEEGFPLRALGPLEGLAEEDFFPVVSSFHL